MDADRLRAVIGSVVVHLILVGVLVLTMWERPQPPAVAVSAPIIQARAVDEATAMEPVHRREVEEQRKKDAAEQLRREAAATKKRQAEEQQKKLAAEQQRLAQEQQKKVEAEKQKKAAELQKKAEVEKQRLNELKRKQETAKIEEEKKQLAEVQRKKDELEKKRKEEEEARRKAGEEKLKQAMAAEEARLREEESRLNAQRRAGMVNQYLAGITRKVQGNWLRLSGMPQDFSCKVWVKQIPSGEVVDVRIIESSGNIMLDRSVEAAVWKSSPLPAPPSPEIFDREVIITFVPR
jgi:colicin import membrane protein